MGVVVLAFCFTSESLIAYRKDRGGENLGPLMVRVSVGLGIRKIQRFVFKFVFTTTEVKISLALVN